MTLVSDSWGGTRSSGVWHSAGGLAGRAGTAVRNARRYDLEHSAANLLTEATLPGELPEVAGYQAATRYIPAEGRVAGDWFDVAQLPGGAFLVRVGERRQPRPCRRPRRDRPTVRQCAISLLHRSFKSDIGAPRPAEGDAFHVISCVSEGGLEGLLPSPRRHHRRSRAMAASGVTGTISQLAQTRHALWKPRQRSRTDTLPGSHSCHRARYASGVFGSVADEDAATLPELRAELLLRAERDQSARRAMTSGNQGGLEDMVKVDLDNSRWLAGVLDDHGWQGGSLVGDDGAGAAWLLAQHADQDPSAREKKPTSMAMEVTTALSGRTADGRK
jgi:hypothetical protein